MLAFFIGQVRNPKILHSGQVLVRPPVETGITPGSSSTQPKELYPDVICGSLSAID